MAQYRINHSCGHTEVAQLYGRHDDRGSRRDYEETRPCPDCRTAQAVVASRATTLGVLEGSPKQIAWAHGLRDKEIAEIEGLLEILRRPRERYTDSLGEVRDVDAAGVASAIEVLTDILSAVERETSCRVIIDRRGSDWVRMHTKARLVEMGVTSFT